MVTTVFEEGMENLFGVFAFYSLQLQFSDGDGDSARKYSCVSQRDCDAGVMKCSRVKSQY